MKRKDWLIAGLIAVLFLFVLGGIVIFWLQSQAYANLPEDVVSGTSQQTQGNEKGITAKEAFLTAEPLAIQWQADAQLVSASAQIIQFNAIEDVYNGKANWSVVYYSPIAQAIANYTITPNGAGFLNAKKIDIKLPILDLEKIKLDSGQAMTIAVSNGAAPLFEGEADRVAFLKLEQSQQTGQPEWHISIQNETSNAFKSFNIDAETGQLNQ